MAHAFALAAGVAIGVAVVFALPACGRAPKPSTVPPGGTHADAPNHPGTWFTADEIGGRLGAKVGPGRIAGPLGTAIQWTGIDDASSYVQIQVVRDVAFWAVPKGDTVVVLPGIGRAAYAQPTTDGWRAAARLDAAFVTVFVGGPTASRERAERLLVDTVSRAR